MPNWARLAATALVWSAAVAGPIVTGLDLGAYALLPIGAGVAATGAWLGLAAGAAAALAAGGWWLNATLDLTAGAEAWRAAAAGGALLGPAALLALGLATGGWRRLLGQLHTHRAAAGRAQYDALTGLLNRHTFEQRVDAWTKEGGRGATPFAVLFVDLDRFKFVNDTFGHATGDQLLIAIARLLQANVREEDLVARLGGDEFVIALRGVRDAAGAGQIANKLVKLLGAPFEIDGKLLNVSASVGVALFPRDGVDVDSLTKSADTAMYAVKLGGRNSYHFSDRILRDRQERRLDLERQLRFALHDQELEVVYQPQIELASGRLVGFEALMRWRNRELGLVSPGEFIPIAEEAGMIVPLGHWLMREVCRQARVWSGYGLPGLTVAINVSPLQFRQPGFLRQVDEAIRDAGVAPEAIEVEVTEGVLIDEFELAAATLRRLDRMGVRTSLDDFGTGYSSLAYLQRLPIQSLKIDRSFISELVLGPTGVVGSVVPIVDAITALGRKLGKTVVAEGVETEAQARYLQRIGVHRAQGYHYAKPLPAEKAERLLRGVVARAVARGGVAAPADPVPGAAWSRGSERSPVVTASGADAVLLLHD